MAPKNILVIAPHPDDETLGAGGTLLNHKNRGDETHWLIMTHATKEVGYSEEFIRKRNNEMERIVSLYGFASTIQLPFTATRLDTYPLREIIEKLSHAIRDIQPDVLYIPHRSDVHSDHRVTHEAAIASCKPFRAPTIKKVLSYETLSETDAAVPDGKNQSFAPNLFVDITGTLEKKMEAMEIYQSEIGKHPFPRSRESVRALAILRGAAANVPLAEAFVVLREIERPS